MLVFQLSTQWNSEVIEDWHSKEIAENFNYFLKSEEMVKGNGSAQWAGK